MIDAHKRRPYIWVSILIRGGDDSREITHILNMNSHQAERTGVQNGQLNCEELT